MLYIISVAHIGLCATICQGMKYLYCIKSD